MSNTLSQKLLEVQKEVVGVTKSSDNPYFHSKYADLNSVLGVIKGPLNVRGIVIANSSGADQHGRYLETSLINVEDNQQISSRKYFSGNEKNLQELGAADTYARRFNLTNLLSLEALDDDGETAVGRTASNSKTVREQPRPAPKVDDSPRGGTVPKAAEASKVDKGEAGSRPPVAEKERETVFKKLVATSKVLVDSKRVAQAELLSFLKAYGVETKEGLTTAQAKELLTKLEEKLK